MDGHKTERDRAVAGAIVSTAQINLVIESLTWVIEGETNWHGESDVAAKLREARDTLVAAFVLANDRHRVL
jgi:hypothetical protein